MRFFLLAYFSLVYFCLGGFVLTLENDYFDGSDDNYTHGTEFEYNYWSVDDKANIYRIGYGLNQLIYTRENIRISDIPLVSDRPWAGTLSLYRETWVVDANTEIRTRIGLGVLGPASHADRSQKAVHKIMGCHKPMGWEHQMPNEVMLNIYQDRYLLIYNYDISSYRIFDVKWLYGGTLGTTFVNLKTGVSFRLGYNIPRYSLPGGIAMKGRRSQLKDKCFAYFVLGVNDSYVLHNATLGKSFIRNRKDGQERDLERFVAEYNYGFVIGYDRLTVAYSYSHRTDEWRGEMDGGMGFGMVRLEFVSRF